MPTIAERRALPCDTAANHRADNRYCAPAPRMPAVQDFSLLGNVGVLLLGCTITIVRTGHLMDRLRTNDLSRKLELMCHRGLETS